MRPEAIAEAKEEALRFLRRLEEMEANPPNSFYPSIERAAVKRASLDLTRALAKMRRGR